MTETDLMQLIRIRLSELGCIVWRNNTGKLQNRNGRWVTYGLCVGSADLIGIAPGGRFLAIEVKTDKGKPTAEQKTFIAAVKAQGGVADVCRSVEDAERLILGISS